MKQKITQDQRGIAFVLELVVIVAVLAVLGFVGYKVYQHTVYRKPNSSSPTPASSTATQKTFEFNQDIQLKLHQTATLTDGDKTIKFRFTEIKPPSNPNAHCDELCTGMLPTVRTELEYLGKTYEGTATTEVTSSLDMSFEKNGAYPLVPYNIELVSTDFGTPSGTVKITKKEFVQAELGKQFTVHNDGVAALVPGKTGMHIEFGTCGLNSPCIQNVDFYVDDEYVTVPLGFTDPNATPALQFASKDGSYAEHNGTRLRLVESDDKTYATFVFEKS